MFEFFEWFSPAGYGVRLELQDGTLDDFALTKAQAKAMLTGQVFGSIAGALPADACVGGRFSQPVDPPKPGDSPGPAGWEAAGYCHVRSGLFTTWFREMPEGRGRATVEV